MSEAAGQFFAQEGLAAFIAHGENTFRLLAYSPAKRFSSHDSAFQETIASFGRLTDRKALAVQPNRISTVRISRAMTLASFNSRFPSVIDIEQLALINQLSGANAIIPAGTPVRRVVRRR